MIHLSFRYTLFRFSQQTSFSIFYYVRKFRNYVIPSDCWKYSKQSNRILKSNEWPVHRQQLSLQKQTTTIRCFTANCLYPIIGYKQILHASSINSPSAHGAQQHRVSVIDLQLFLSRHHHHQTGAGVAGPAIALLQRLLPGRDGR